ncbi:CHAD domain-containing protein [Paraburkholderia denitrificans]|uniref:CHAD domain-containing protein n=1 Tax=Paraburkholderia denitrificans TaxID=694025 RepID=A0ABW0J3B9_9BURK
MVRVLEIVLDIVYPAACNESVDTRHPGDRTAAVLARELAAALPQLVALSAESECVTAVTFDRDAALARAGWRVAVETRGDGNRVVVSNCRITTPGITARTAVFDAPLDANGFALASLDAAPVLFRHALAAAGEPVPAAALCGERCRWQWMRDGIEVELVLDAGLHDPNQPPDETRCLHELRVRAPWPEEADAAPVADALFACAHDLVDAAPASLPAFVRINDVLDRMAAGCLAGDGDAVHAEPVDLGGVDTAQGALVAIARNITNQWLGNDAGVRDSAKTEFIHQMRVSQRRLRTALRLFSGWQDDAWATRIMPDLKWLGSMLGDARDRDVFVDSTLPALVDADTEAARWDALRAQADAMRLAARARARAALASPRYAHLTLAWLQWLSVLAQRDSEREAHARSLHKHAAKQVRRYYARLAGMQKLTAIDEASRHRARINAKYLRYALEFFAPITSRRTRTETTRTLARLQAVLGDGNDAAVALRFLEAMDVEPYQLGFAHGWCEAVKRCSAKEGERLLRELRKPKVQGG